MVPPPAKLVRRGGSWQGPAWRLSAICFFMVSSWKASVWSLVGSWELEKNDSFSPKLQTTEEQSVAFGIVIRITHRGSRKRGVWVL